MNVLAYTLILLPMAFSFKYLPEDDGSIYPLLTYVAPKHVAVASDIPHHTLIVYGNLYCSGALIRSRIVVTTASCFERRRRQKIYVKLGVDTITSPGQVKNVQELKKHEYYKHRSAVHNDIALLVLEENVSFSENVKKVILVEPDVAIREGTTIEASGWGHTNVLPKFTNNLLLSDMMVMSQENCKAYYRDLITSSSYCARYQSERRLSDNGGPALFRNMLVGLLSFGATNKEEPYVAVFTNVSFFHRWITLNSFCFLEKYCQEENLTKSLEEMYYEEDEESSDTTAEE